MTWQQPAAPAATADVTGGEAVAPTAGLDLHQTVQNALADLLSIAGLQNEDSWDASSAQPGVTSRLPQQLRGGSERPAPGPLVTASSRSTPAPSFGAPAVEPARGASEQEEEEVVQEQDLPPAAAARLYQARLRAAQGELESLQAAVKARDARLGGLEKEVQALRQDCIAEQWLDKAGWQKQQKALELQVDKGRRAAEEARGRLAEQESALKQLGLERRASQQERRQSEAEVKARESKLGAALEEAQRLRRLLEEARAATTARAGVSREEHAQVLGENRQLAAQKQELVGAFGKASKLIDVLRRQRVHLEAAALLRVSSRELAEALQQQPPAGQ